LQYYQKEKDRWEDEEYIANSVILELLWEELAKAHMKPGMMIEAPPKWIGEYKSSYNGIL
jgi:hypothetical protein